MAKKLKGIKTGFFERGLSIAKLSIQTGTKAAAYGLGNLLQGESDGRREKMLVEQMALLAEQFGNLKGSLMKVGQMLSVYGEHFLPPEANKLLKTLHFESPPLEWPSIEKHLRRQLTKELLAELDIEKEPLAAASLGQVHRARILKTGTEIVLKIQYPGVEDAVEGDIKALKRLLSLTNFLPKLPETDSIFAEVKAMLLQELDYRLELERLTEFQQLFENDKRYIVPTPYPEFCAKRVIAMSYEPGVRMDGREVACLSQERRNILGENFLDLYFRELFELQSVQTDPHFGNYRVRIGESIVLFDFGAVRKVPKEFLVKYKQFVGGVFFQDPKRFLEGASALGLIAVNDPEELIADFWALCSLIMEPFTSKQVHYDWAGSKLAQRVAKQTGLMATKHPLRTPPRELVFLDRKMAGVFTALAMLDVTFSGRPILERYLK